MTLRVAIGGFGAIGKVVAHHLDRGIDGLALAAVSARDVARAEAAMAGFVRPVPVLPLARLGEEAEVVVECAPDAVLAAAEGGISRVHMVTRKPPQGLAGAPYLEANAIAVTGLSEPKRVFTGSAREAARGFPANVNVAAALALAGIGPDRTTIEIWADPALTRNVHRIEVEAKAARLSMHIENVPSPENPRTGR